MRAATLLSFLMLTFASSCMPLAMAYFYVGALLHPGSWGSAGMSTNNPAMRVGITDVALVPDEVHVGDTVLLDFTLGSEQVQAANDTVAVPPITPVLMTSDGEVLPLLPAAYLPGGEVPQATAARAALAGYAPPYTDAAVLQQAFRDNGHAYLLFVAPDDPGVVTVTLSCGAPRAPLAPGARREVTITVLP
jgi:hypothetical protein